MTGILKVHLLTLERSAETLERIVYNALVELEKMPARDVPSMEARILRKLEKLDDIQAEIDAVTAKLKEAGEWEPADHSRNLYQYNTPISKPIKPAPLTPKSNRIRKSVKVEGYWRDVARHMRHGDGTITTMQCTELLNLTRAHTHGLVQRWADEGRLKPSHKVGKAVIYRAA